jgi:hypothetical protein
MNNNYNLTASGQQNGFNQQTYGTQAGIYGQQMQARNNNISNFGLLGAII